MNRLTPSGSRLRLGLVCPSISGHLNPALALASALRDRGHEVGFFGLADGGQRVAAAGFEFRPIAADRFPVGTVPAWMKQQGELTGRAAMRWILRCLREEGLAMMDQLGPELEHWGAEGALIDQVSHGAVSVAQRQRLAYLTLCHAMPVHADVSVPPFSTTLPHRPGRWGRVRNALCLSSFAPMIAAYFRPLNLVRRQWGLPLLTPWSGSDSSLAVLSQVPAAFEFPGRRLPSHFHLTGPWIRFVDA
jgi:zeaxanthin glucosyltransferase